MDLETPANGFILASTALTMTGLAGFSSLKRDDYKVLSGLFHSTIVKIYAVIIFFTIGSEWVWGIVRPYLTMDEIKETLSTINIISPDILIVAVCFTAIFVELQFIDVCIRKIENNKRDD